MAAPERSESITVVANGPLGHALAEALGSAPPLLPEPGPAPPLGPLGDLVIVALEDCTFGELLAFARALLLRGQSALFVTVEGDVMVAGPVTVPGLTACLECRLLASMADDPDPRAALEACRALAVGGATDLPPGVLDAGARAIAGAMRTLDHVVPGRRPFTSVGLFSAVGRAHATTLPSEHCGICPPAPVTDDAIVRASVAEVGVALEMEGLARELAYAPEPLAHPDRYRSVGVLGGGTAGYLTALALRARIPGLQVTLIESSRIPIISVGEATTPDMVKFLHAPAQLNCDIVDFHRRVRPALKLGIQFLWGRPGDGRFNYPFQYAPLLDPMAHDGNMDGQSIASLLMSADRSPLIAGVDGAMHSLLEVVRFAYHLDNQRFVAYLSEEARRRGVGYLDATVSSAALAPDGETIDHLVTDDGRRLRFDLYVDASGFRSVLMGGALGSPFVSYASSLFTDRAIAANAPHGGVVKPYTRAHTLGAGWCWTIPFEEDDHLGYVYASAFVTEDEALAEMRRIHPQMGEPRHIRFRSGRHAHFIRGNVVAVGNAYAFVEPLESTALHMLIYEIEHLTNHFPVRSDRAIKDQLNRRMNDMWDRLRGFLAIHYRFNRRLDTEFWRAVRATADIGGVEDRVALFGERAPLSSRPSLFYSGFAPDFFAGDHAFDTLLLGQAIAARLPAPPQSPGAWRRRATLRRQVVERALPQAVALPRLRGEESTLLQRFAESPESWVHNWIAR